MRQYDVAAYIWPSYHYEPRMEHWWPEKDGEWYTVRRATPRFPGHKMPRVPLLGYQDEANPDVMRQHVALAREHGVNVFVMDWYWYENAPCFERQLNDGLIPALEGSDTRFYLMWANHDANSLWDMHTDEKKLLWSGQVSREILEPMFDRVIDRYLTLPCYYRIDDKPVFSIFLHGHLMAGLGGVEATQDAFAWMRRRCVEKGLPGLHIQTIAQMGFGGVEAGAKLEKSEAFKAAQVLKFDSATSYQYCWEGGEEGEYMTWAQKSVDCWDYFAKAYNVFFPHVAIGWDNTHRNPSKKGAVMGACPDAFEVFLRKARDYLDAHPDQAPLLTINSWNEWTEGSYLLPDEEWGYGYLQAVRKVFGGK